MNLDAFYKQFCTEEFDENGVLSTFTPVLPDHFQFAGDVVDRIAMLDPERRALVWCNDQGEEHFFSFGDMKRYSDQCAQMFSARGIIKGDFVMVALRRHYEFWFVMLALEKIGAVAVPVHHALSSAELLYRFRAANITACVVSGECDIAQTVDDVCCEYPSMRARFIVRGERANWLPFQSELEHFDGCWERKSFSKSESCVLHFTSGTAAEPKMVLHDHAYAAAHILTGRYWNQIRENDLHMAIAETGWMKALWGKLYGPWFCGAAVMVYDFTRFSAEKLLSVIQKYQVTTFCAPAIIYRSLVQDTLCVSALSALHCATTAGETLPPEVFARFKKLTGLSVMESFGQTETAMLAANLAGMDAKPGSMGKPCPGAALRLLDEDGLDVPAGAAGELCVTINDSVLGLFQGYYCDMSATNACFRDGLYHTGDMAWMDEDGYLWYIGRTDDVIKASGYRIGPIEIESLLMTHPAVTECAVTGAPDPSRGTVVKATVVLAPGFEPSEALIKELQDTVKKQTAPYKYPRIVEFVKKLPRTLSGKIRRSEIRANSTSAS